MGSEAEKFNPNITWEVINRDELVTIVDHTIEETILQDVSTANTASELLPRIPPDNNVRIANSIGLIQQTTDRAVKRIRALQDILRQDPSIHIPIDHRYENTTGHLIIALDSVLNPPILIHK